MLIDSLLSVFFLILVGVVLRKTLLPSEEAWKSIERVSYYVLFPALMIKTLAAANLATTPVLALAASLVIALLIMSALLVLSQKQLEMRAGMDGPAFTSLFQGVVRWNAFVAIALAGNLYGAQGIALTSIAVAGMIPLINVISISVLRRWGSGTSGSFLRGLVTNPFIVSTLIGILIGVTGVPIPKSIDLTLSAAAQGALGLGLLMVGAGLRLDDLKKSSFAIWLSVGLRLIVMPLLGAMIAMAFGLSGPALAIVVICLGVPSASASYILARQMGGDAPLMAAMLTAQTLLSAITLPLLLIRFSG